jgi:hypothetical protein
MKQVKTTILKAQERSTPHLVSKDRNCFMRAADVSRTSLCARHYSLCGYGRGSSGIIFDLSAENKVLSNIAAP